MKEEPDKKKAAPAEAESGCFAKQAENSTKGGETQESAATILTKTWHRSDGITRRNFLRDVRAGMPNLWRAVEREFAGTGVKR